MFVVTVNTGAVFALCPQAEKLLDKIRHSVAESIKKDYGKQNITTEVWNDAMTLVHYITFLC